MIEIPVTQDDIDAGVPDYIKPDSCVVARALKRCLEKEIVLVGWSDVYVGEKWDAYQFDEALVEFAANIRDAFHEVPHPSILPGVIYLDKQTMTASYEERKG